MKKTTFYTLLCTTILIPSLASAMQQDELSTPVAQDKKKGFSGLRTSAIDGPHDTPISKDAAQKEKAVLAKLGDKKDLRAQKEQEIPAGSLHHVIRENIIVQSVEIAASAQEDDANREFDRIREEATRQRAERGLKARQEAIIRSQEEAEALVAKLNAQAAKTAQTTDNKIRELEEARRAMEGLNREKERLLEEKESLARQAHQLEEQKEELTRQNADTTREKEDLARVNSQLESNSKVLEQYTMASIANSTALLDQSKQKDGIISELSKRLSDLEEQKHKKESDLAVLNAKLEVYESRIGEIIQAQGQVQAHASAHTNNGGVVDSTTETDGADDLPPDTFG